VEQAFGNRLEIKGPSPSPIEKIKDQYRWQLWYFAPSASRVIGELNQLRENFAWPDDIVQMLDVDPASLV
jgi:primosomal protein N' (replication factor Y)